MFDTQYERPDLRLDPRARARHGTGYYLQLFIADDAIFPTAFSGACPEAKPFSTTASITGARAVSESANNSRGVACVLAPASFAASGIEIRS